MAVPNYNGIPQALKDCPHWVLWKYEEKRKKNGDVEITKVPYQPNGRRASSKDPKTWNDFETVKKAYEMHVGEGMGFVFTRDTFSGVDLDHCRDKSTGEMDFWATRIIKQLDSFPEISPSGEGIHVIIGGSIPEGCTGKKKLLVDPPNTTVFERMYCSETDMSTLLMQER